METNEGKDAQAKHVLTVQCREEVCGISGMMEIVDMNELDELQLAKKKTQKKRIGQKSKWDINVYENEPSSVATGSKLFVTILLCMHTLYLTTRVQLEKRNP